MRPPCISYMYVCDRPINEAFCQQLKSHRNQREDWRLVICLIFLQFFIWNNIIHIHVGMTEKLCIVKENTLLTLCQVFLKDSLNLNIFLCHLVYKQLYHKRRTHFHFFQNEESFLLPDRAVCWGVHGKRSWYRWHRQRGSHSDPQCCLASPQWRHQGAGQNKAGGNWMYHDSTVNKGIYYLPPHDTYNLSLLLSIHIRETKKSTGSYC